MKESLSTMEPMLSVGEVASYLAVTERTVYRLVKEHCLPAYKVGGSWRFKRDEIEHWMQHGDSAS